MPKFSQITSNSTPALADSAVGVTAANVDNRFTLQSILSLFFNNVPAGSIRSANLATTQGEIGGAWKSVTPAFTGIVAGTSFYQIMRYIQIGKTVICNVGFQLGSGGSVSGPINVTLPVNAAAAMVGLGAGWAIHAGNCVFVKNATGEYNGTVEITSASNASFLCMHVNGTVIDMAAAGATTPFTWNQYDRMYATLIYEAA